VPANARVDRFIPQDTLLPTCAAVVHHGGAGTTFGALAHGLPQVVLPQGADNFVHAAVLERAGVARVLRPGEVTPGTIQDAVRHVLGEPSYRGAAHQVAAEIATMPSPAQVANALRTRYARDETLSGRSDGADEG
jgi:UDP:flavonoid glycosyltransferase YjiC (YdhE family)